MYFRFYYFLICQFNNHIRATSFCIYVIRIDHIASKAVSFASTSVAVKRNRNFCSFFVADPLHLSLDFFEPTRGIRVVIQSMTGEMCHAATG